MHMAYRRKQGVPRVSTFKEDIGSAYPPPPPDESSSSSSASSLAAKAIRASSAYRDSSLSSAYGQSALSSPRDSNSLGSSSPSSVKNSKTYEYTSIKGLSEPKQHEYTSIKGLDEPKQGFWGVLARKAKAILEDDKAAEQLESPRRTKLEIPGTAARSQYANQHCSPENHCKADSPSVQKGLGAIASSLNYIGGTIGNALEEGLTIVENRTADIIQETRKLQIRKKGSSSETRNQGLNAYNTQQLPLMHTHMQPQMQTDLETQLKASRDVAMAMAAKAKLLLRELKTVKADLAFAKERCAQLEEENRILRESRGKGASPEDDDLIRLQLETLLAEKARLAQENSVFARENRFLREIVEYHQLTMQDVVYLDEGSEEVTEIYPIKVPSVTNLQSFGSLPNLTPSPSPSPVGSHSMNPEVAQDVTPLNVPPAEIMDASRPVTSH